MLRQMSIEQRWSSSADSLRLRKAGFPTTNGHAVKAYEPGRRQPT